MSLRRALHSSVAALCIAGVAAPAGLAAPVAQTAPRGALDVHVGEAKDFTRLELHWAGGAQAVTRRDGQTVSLKFNRDANPDIARLKYSPPHWLKGAEARHDGGRLELILTLTDDADVKMGSADGATYVNLFQRVDPPPTALAANDPAAAPADAVVAPPPIEPEPERPNPVPAGGVVHMGAAMSNGQVMLTFPWANPNGAAVFRRGAAVWVVFDAAAIIDVAHAPRGLKQFSTIQAIKGEDYSAIRIASPVGTPIFASSQGGTWTIALGNGPQGQAAPIRIGRDDVGGPAALKAEVAGTTRSVRVVDPVVGDTLSVVTALGPSKGVQMRREYVQMAVLPSAQGLAMEAYVEDLNVQRDGDLVHIGRPQGLALSPVSAQVQRVEAQLGAPQPASMPGLIDDVNWPKTGEGGFLARYNALLQAASDEALKGKDAPVAQRMAFARFLVGSQLSFEAIGFLNDTARANPDMLDNPEFRGLRGMARVMARRYKEAQADFAAPALSDDPSISLWRAYTAAQLAEWPEARSQFLAGSEAFGLFNSTWKTRFARADAQAALALGDIDGANRSIRLALEDRPEPLEELATRLVEAKVIEAQGQPQRALGVYKAIMRAPTEALTAPATLRATQIQLQLGQISPTDAANVFAGLRYRWRGDATELETIRALGQLYLSQGRYREALEAFRSAPQGRSDAPELIQIQADLNNAFRALFLDGAADGLEPVQALALFYDFQDLTPLGADGDLMVRKLVRRLVDVDLLDQAATLLKYQVDNRLDGVPQAQVATDLAVIYLMNRKPEQALQAINDSRTTILPAALNGERRLIEARALMGLGRLDAAEETIERDTSKDGQDLRTEIAWKRKDWPTAGAMFEKSLGDRFKSPTALASDEEGKLLRAGVAYSLAGDDASLTRLYSRYQGFIAQAHNPDALQVALSGISNGQLSVADFGRVTADNESFAGWVGKMKARFKERPAPLGPPTRQVAAAPAPAPIPVPAKTAQAAPARKAAKG
ncbi:tetratricopeptide repeat protein [Phenylobacterium aquaticum]|uniref:tetratricopeptide repeat protein n=1 Tax=Phenylobacterium aquaticum TaxID=1763816 RepID=UPI0026EB501B|nr:tetratricopeptide repeat protein [Phenylobacterium aquaticum]